MSFLDRLRNLNPLSQLDKAVKASVEDKTHAAFQTVVRDVSAVSPELSDLLSGQPVELTITAKITLQIKQKGE